VKAKMIAEATQQSEKRGGYREWTEFGNQMSPRVRYWSPVSGIAAGLMLYFFPVSVGASIGLVLLAMFAFCVAYYTGVSIFTWSCKSFGRLAQTAKLRYIVPILLTIVAGIGLLGGGYWWIFAFAVALVGSRKGMTRGWWEAVTFKACGLRGNDEMMSMNLFPTDGDALSAAIEIVDKETGRR
jgi:hypothetical protein